MGALGLEWVSTAKQQYRGESLIHRDGRPLLGQKNMVAVSFIPST